MLTIFRDHYLEFLGGLKVTLELCAIIWSCGLILGTVFGAVASMNRWVGLIIRVTYVCLVAVPSIVILFWLHYPAQRALDVVIDPFITAAVTFSFINTVMVSEIVRAGVAEFPRQYLEAARVCGLTRADTIRHVSLPIIIRGILPGILLTQIAMLQATLFASFISVNEIFRVVQRVNSMEYQSIPIFTTLAVLFLAVCAPIYLFAEALKRRYTRDISER